MASTNQISSFNNLQAHGRSGFNSLWVIVKKMITLYRKWMGFFNVGFTEKTTLTTHTHTHFQLYFQLTYLWASVWSWRFALRFVFYFFEQRDILMSSDAPEHRRHSVLSCPLIFSPLLFSSLLLLFSPPISSLLFSSLLFSSLLFSSLLSSEMCNSINSCVYVQCATSV